jgi:hypothetical protein
MCDLVTCRGARDVPCSAPHIGAQRRPRRGPTLLAPAQSSPHPQALSLTAPASTLTGLDLTTNRTPPKSLYVTVRAVVDCGEIVGEDGTSIRLEQHSENLVRRQDVEMLIKLGHLVEVS